MAPCAGFSGGARAGREEADSGANRSLLGSDRNRAARPMGRSPRRGLPPCDDYSSEGTPIAFRRPSMRKSHTTGRLLFEAGPPIRATACTEASLAGDPRDSGDGRFPPPCQGGGAELAVARGEGRTGARSAAAPRRRPRCDCASPSPTPGPSSTSSTHTSPPPRCSPPPVPTTPSTTPPRATRGTATSHRSRSAPACPCPSMAAGGSAPSSTSTRRATPAPPRASATRPSPGP